MYSRKGQIQKHFWITIKQNDDFRKQAEQNHMSETAYFKALITNKPCAFADISAQLGMLINEINRIGNNINQIAKRNNAGFGTVKDNIKVLEYQRQIKELLKETMDKYGY